MKIATMKVVAILERAFPTDRVTESVSTVVLCTVYFPIGIENEILNLPVNYYRKVHSTTNSTDTLFFGSEKYF